MRKLLLLSSLIAAGALAACEQQSDAPTPEPQASAQPEAEPEPVTEPAIEPEPEPETPVDAFYVGRWAADPAWCTDQSEGFPIEIETARFLGRENVCDMSGVTDTPEGGWTAQLSCQSEGMVNEEALIMAPVGDQLAITWPDRDTEATLFSRC